MCSITASFDFNKLKELTELNAYRGSHSHSLFVFDKFTGSIIFAHKNFGPIELDEMSDSDIKKLPEGSYFIAHQQAPTTESKNEDSVHPATLGNNYLWHNGIIKEKEIKRLQEELKSSSKWDTELLLQKLMYEGKPNNIDGTFSCMWYNNKNLFCFRNEISPLFVDGSLNISSTKFEGGTSLPPNKIFELDLLFKENNTEGLNQVGTFLTKENPYYFGDE